MIKSALYEPSFSDRFVGLTGFHCGVVLSGTLGHDEHLFLPIELPPKEDTERGRSEIKPLRCIRDIDEKWVASHCRNLNRMIPGGIRISGICLTSTLSEFNSEQEHLKRILFNLPKTDPMIGEITGARENEKLVLLCDPQSKKFTCKILDVGSSVSIFRSATVKPQMFIHSYRTFRTTISLSVETILPADRQKEEILLQLQAAVKPYLQSLLRESNLLINGEFRDSIDYVLADVGEKAMVDVLSSSKQRKRSSKVSKRRSFGAEKTSDYGESGDFGTETYLEREPSDPGSDKGCWADVELTIFGPQFPRWKRASSSSSLESGTSSDTGYTGGTDRTDSSGSGLVPINRLIVNGCIPGIAFLPSDTTVGTLFEALRKDLIQSILARLELLTEELHITSSQLEVPRMLLPQRVLVRLPACPRLPLSDYKFISETADDVISRLQYFCVPIGLRGSGDGNDVSLDRLSSSDRPASLESLSSGVTSASSLPSRDLIDASCLDISLEQSPEGNAETEYSETELLENVAHSVQPVTKYLSFSSPTFLIAGCLALLGSLLASYLLIGPWNAEAT
ncbi:Protein odr-4 [Clonorchis sinensis]|uniref:Protein odr-4 n=1 Tax=Clonorchis sinensis TaxID=79923 RepID=A0A3R7EN17_CLOSI|nr:Protein odr-4 [Clonorchis sinensis]